jgi:hypothetical protein
MTKYKYRATHKTTTRRALGASVFDTSTMAELAVIQLRDKHPNLFKNYRFDVVPVYVEDMGHGTCANCAYRSFRDGIIVCCRTDLCMGRMDTCPDWRG